MLFSQKILKWYHENKRELPWRSTKDPYRIWLSEVILQQTRVAQGLPYYQNFLESFPTVYHLACASEQKVLKLWQGLGYYSRARNLHATAKMVVEHYDGKFPNTYEELKKLKGIGDYTASAIASICFGIPEPVVDGNVYRVLARFFGVELPINTTKGIKYFKKLAREVMDSENSADYNQGIMEFGAVQCAPKNPKCQECPLNAGCKALKDNKVQLLPLKQGKTKIKNRHFNYLVYLDSKKNTILEQRQGRGIWQNLYQFPLLESEKEMDLSEVKDKAKNADYLPSWDTADLYNGQPIVHKLSHQHLYTKFWILRTEEILVGATPWNKIHAFPVPVLIADFIQRFKI
ncbi:A/G-specific adenine glycosylase [Muricauda sp. JGD-17]|uniref:Adenine DNA glycosylase n=1 Tax=Flagellimonas ochracea TaxID=2696472 RepID=A0A964WXB6_9FLAO|nr:A/G-specific adenine glycosylase [Allomuricauda ochracea]NAY91961.1 A/G-specific adenine glycosylase [Allomuricauda ochracea]